MKKILAAIALAAALMSCVNVNEKLGGDFIATNLKYDFYSAEFDLEDIWMKSVDSLSGYSSSRINFGAIRDDNYGLFSRGCVVTLVPVLKSVDFGQDPVFKRFRFQAVADSVSVADESQSRILQNVQVYSLTEPLDPTKYYSRTEVKHGTNRITKGVPVVNGTDSLSFDFTEEYGKRYLNITKEDMSDFQAYCKKFPGIYITTDEPVGNGGRFNMFKMGITEVYNNYLVRSDNYAVMYYSGIYNGERKDTSLMFYFSPLQFQNLDSLISIKSTPEQFVFNVDSHETASLAGKAVEKIFIEGGSGIKPVISAEEIRRLVTSEISSKGGDPTIALISKATIEMPFEFPDDYRTMYLFPQILSPTMKIATDTTVAFADPCRHCRLSVPLCSPLGSGPRSVVVSGRAGSGRRRRTVSGRGLPGEPGAGQCALHAGGRHLLRGPCGPSVLRLCPADEGTAAADEKNGSGPESPADGKGELIL